MGGLDYDFPPAICQWCEQLCDAVEVVETGCVESHWELWCYCEACDAETFHPGVVIRRAKGS